MANIKKAFMVKELPGQRTKKVFDYEEVKNNKGKLVRQRTETDVPVPNGWMVFFPNGSSIHVTSIEEMNRLGFAEGERIRNAKLIDLDSGEIVGDAGDTDFETISERKSNRGKAKKEFNELAAE